MTLKTKALAPLLQQLELEQPRVVTKIELGSLATLAGVDWPIEVVIRRLREAGWLLDLCTRGVWEFAPAARAGPFSSGDSFIELRATLARDGGALSAVAAESAAYLLGLASRRPDREVIGAPAGVRMPKALRDLRVVHWTPRAEFVVKDGLPVWSITTLLYDLAWLASRPFDEALVRRVTALKIWSDVVDDGLGDRPWNPDEILRPRPEAEFIYMYEFSYRYSRRREVGIFSMLLEDMCANEHCTLWEVKNLPFEPLAKAA